MPALTITIAAAQWRVLLTDVVSMILFLSSYWITSHAYQKEHSLIWFDQQLLLMDGYGLLQPIGEFQTPLNSYHKCNRDYPSVSFSL